MKQIECVVYMTPTAKGRPRFVHHGNFTHAFTPKKTRDAETSFRVAVMEAINGATFEQGVPLRVEMTFYLSKPTSMSKKVIYPVKRPDLDNYVKCLDALNGYVFPDDSQIITIIAKKRFGEPRIELKITEIVE